MNIFARVYFSILYRRMQIIIEVTKCASEPMTVQEWTKLAQDSVASYQTVLNY